VRQTRWIAALIPLVLLLGACGGDGATDEGDGNGGGLTPVSFRLDWIVDGSHTCFFVAESEGFFRDEGLEVEILEGAGSGTAATLVANGSNDFGFSDAGVVARTINEGASIKLVMDIFQRSPAVIISMQDAGIEGPEDLVGTAVGATSGEAPLQLLPAYLSANGVDPTAVEVVNIDPAAKISALLEGRVDAIVGYSSSDLPIAEGEAPGQLNVQHYADYGVVTMSNGIITSTEMIEQNPEVVGGFVRAVQKGFEFCEQDPEAAVQILVDRFPQTVNPDQASIALREVLSNLRTERTQDQPIGFIDEEDWNETIQNLVDYAEFTDPQEPSGYFTNEFIE
jgi:NitT/TauT family transport system substrate-binding protein